jgi:hypothetical protein
MSKGIWTIERHGNGYALYSGRSDTQHGLNLVYLSEPDGRWERVKALIESAPDLLAACEKMIEAFEYSGTRLVGSEYEARELIKAAIKKAKGDQ